MKNIQWEQQETLFCRTNIFLQEYEVRRTSMELTQAVPQTDILDVTAQR